MPRHHRIAAGLVTLILALDCGRSRPAGASADPRVGDMADVSYSGGRELPYGPNARGRTVGLADFAGRFVWVEYAAPWCAACTPQAEAARALEGFRTAELVTLTVLTSGNDVKEPARPAHAAEWARRFGLAPERVVTDSNWARTVPQHALFSPTGQTLLRRTGSLSSAELVELAGRHMDDWKEWTASGRKASWMR